FKKRVRAPNFSKCPFSKCHFSILFCRNVLSLSRTFCRTSVRLNGKSHCSMCAQSHDNSCHFQRSMRRLALLCLAVVAATNAYRLVIQEINLTGGLVKDGITVNCATIDHIHIDGQSRKFDCFTIFSPTETTSIESVNIVYMDEVLKSKKTNINCEIFLTDNDSVAFILAPQMGKVGVPVQQTDTKGTYKPVGTTAAPTPKSTLGTILDNSEDCAEATKNERETAKAVKKTIIRKPLLPEIAETTTNAPAATDAATVILPLGLRHRGPGPVRPPIRQPPIEDTADNEEEEERRIKRDTVDSTIAVVVTFYILDEAGNPAAVWAAVIEGIILMVLVGACFYFFFWVPRSRAVGAASADPYKDGPNYTVSYANSGYNNQRIDAFQNPPAAPAAPARPANSSYMDDYITDNIGARPAAAAPAASAANPVQSDFRPGHQRFDSSGLVTVNLS
ncbi:hypothetical protein PMAYCL1PPCAC_13195, partial [Pristionchus mayeri]